MNFGEEKTMSDFYTQAREHHNNRRYAEALELYQKGAVVGDAKCYYGIQLQGEVNSYGYHSIIEWSNY